MAKCNECGTTWLDVADPAQQGTCPMCENKRLRGLLADEIERLQERIVDSEARANERIDAIIDELERKCEAAEAAKGGK